MSNMLPKTQMKQFRALKDHLVTKLFNNYLQELEDASTYEYTDVRPRKANQFYAKYSGDTSTYYMEMEYRKVLMCVFYDFTEPDHIEFQFSTKWTDDELEEAEPEFYLPLDIDDEGEFFQQSLIDNFYFLTHDTYKDVLSFIMEIHHEVTDLVEEHNKLYSMC